MFRLKYEVFGEVQLSRAFDLMVDDTEDLTPLFYGLADDYYRTMVQVFESEGAFEERERWADLSPSYAAWKARAYPGRKILERSGRMKLAATTKGAEENITVIKPEEMTLGLSTPYAAKHQTGILDILPQRKIIELTENQKKRWVQITHFFFHRLRQRRVNMAYKRRG